MKALEWQDFFAQQLALHRKVVFSVAELANASRTDPHVLNTELGRLVRRGLITRYAQGRYGPTGGVNVEDILPAVDPRAYITGFSALFRHHLVTQVPREITCFTDHRHNRTANRDTPVGKLSYVHVPPMIYQKPARGVIASAEQALCDFFWLTLRNGVEPRSLVTFRNLDSLKSSRLKKILGRYPAIVQQTVGKVIASAVPGAHA